jgi:hypothetical protein
MFPKRNESGVIIYYMISPTRDTKPDIAIARVGAELEETNRSQGRSEAADTTCAIAGQLTELDESLLRAVSHFSDDIQPAHSELNFILETHACVAGLGFHAIEGCRLIDKRRNDDRRQTKAMPRVVFNEGRNVARH